MQKGGLNSGLSTLERSNERRHYSAYDGDDFVAAATHTYKYSEPVHWKFYIGWSQHVNCGEEHEETRECAVATRESHVDWETERGGQQQQLGVQEHCGEAGLGRCGAKLNEVAPAVIVISSIAAVRLIIFGTVKHPFKFD